MKRASLESSVRGQYSLPQTFLLILCAHTYTYIKNCAHNPRVTPPTMYTLALQHDCDRTWRQYLEHKSHPPIRVRRNYATTATDTLANTVVCFSDVHMCMFTVCTTQMITYIRTCTCVCACIYTCICMCVCIHILELVDHTLCNCEFSVCTCTYIYTLFQQTLADIRNYVN